MIRMAIINRFQLQGRAVIACAMIPLVAFSGLPAYGCICADGHYEPHCASRDRSGNLELANGCCGRSCCAKRAADDKPRICCQGHTVRGLASRPTQARTIETNITGKGCCTPAVRAVVVATVVRSLQAVEDHLAPAIDALSVEAGEFHVGARLCPHFLADIGPPPDDLVVTLGRLVI